MVKNCRTSEVGDYVRVRTGTWLIHGVVVAGVPKYVTVQPNNRRKFPLEYNQRELATVVMTFGGPIDV